MPNTIINTLNNNNTLLGLVNQLAVQTNAPFVAMLDTTINHKRNVYPTTQPTTLPTLRYFGIGITGFYNVDDGILASPYVPSEENMDLHTPIPFRCVPVAEDLDPATRALYRMRTKENYGGSDYYCYWLKVITWPDPTIKVTRVNTVEETEVPYVFDNTNLNPIPDPNAGVDEIDEVTEKVVVSTEGVVTISGVEVAEAINIIYGGNFQYARISEYGFYTGEDQTVEGLDHLDDPFDYDEAIYAQLATHRCSTGTDVSDPASVVEETVVYANGSHYLI